jgi:hypothetical protein
VFNPAAKPACRFGTFHNLFKGTNQMNYLSITNIPNGVKDLITGTIYPYNTGDDTGRRAAERSAVVAQNIVISNLGLPAKSDSDLINLKVAYAASQE